MNSVSNSGRWNVSDVFSAALWTLDGSFEVAQAGGIGVNLHWGAGQNVYTPVIRWYQQGKAAPPIIRPPFYGYLLFQQALMGGSQFINKGASNAPSSLKIWPLRDTKSADVRIVIINKDGFSAIQVNIKLTNVADKYGPATLTRLVATGSNPLTAKYGVTLAGQTVDASGRAKGSYVFETVPKTTPKGFTTYSVYMPPGSAALLEVRKSSS